MNNNLNSIRQILKKKRENGKLRLPSQIFQKLIISTKQKLKYKDRNWTDKEFININNMTISQAAAIRIDNSVY